MTRNSPASRSLDLIAEISLGFRRKRMRSALSFDNCVDMTYFAKIGCRFSYRWGSIPSIYRGKGMERAEAEPDHIHPYRHPSSSRLFCNNGATGPRIFASCLAAKPNYSLRHPLSSNVLFCVVLIQKFQSPIGLHSSCSISPTACGTCQNA